MRAKLVIVFGDLHIPHHHVQAVEVFSRAVERLRPDLLVCLGDILDCSQFTAFPPVYGVRETSYASDLQTANKLLDRLQNASDELVLLEGNHEYRLARWAAATSEGRGSFDMLAPQKRLTENRKRCRYISYGNARGTYPHYSINSRTAAVHGWSYAQNAARIHLQAGQGRSIIYGHTHRAEVVISQNIWKGGKVVQARGAGCLCNLVPFYGTGRPVQWVHAFILGYLGRRSDSWYTVVILQDRCILPDGSEIAAR